MIVRTLEDLKVNGNYREKPGVWSSARYLLRDDGVGITLTQTTIAAGSSQTMEYKNHIEANLIIEGEGELRHRQGVPAAAGLDVRARQARPPRHRGHY